MFEKFVPGL